MTWAPLNLTVRVGCHLVYETTFPTPVPRIGRVKVAHGLDAVDGAFATIYGEAKLVHFEVWAYQVNPTQVSAGDPIDLSKCLDGTQTVRFS